jgi:hypothetical protein
VAIRVVRAGKVNYAPTSQVYRLTVGQVIGGDVGAFLEANARQHVEVIPDPAAPAETRSGGDNNGDTEDAASAEAGGEGREVTAEGRELPRPEVLTDPTADPFDPSGHNVDDVMAYVDANPGKRAAVRRAEREGRARTTLLTRLAD